MPNYDFYCEKCGHQFEKFFTVDDDRKSLKCPECSSKKVERNFGNISLGVSKGTGGKIDCSDTSCGSCSSDCKH